jgi:hypothetical protein
MSNEVTTSTYGGWYSTVPGVAHESLADVCTILDSFQAPFFSSAPKIRATDVVHSWAIDTLMAPVTASRREVSAFAAAAITSPARLTNVCQIFGYDVEVSDRERETNPAGIRDPYDHIVMKAFKQIGRDYESWVFSVGATASASGQATATAPSGLGIRGFSLIVSNAPGGVTTADIIRASESLFNAGAEPDSMWFAPANKRQFVAATSGTGGFNVRNIAADDKRLVANVDVFESPFNQLYAVITDRFIPTASASATGAAYFIGDRAMAKVAFFRPPQHKAMGKASDGTRGIVLMDATLQLDHPSAWAAVTGVTNG